jgi:hypothetical protein
MKTDNVINYFVLIWKMILYNLRIIFANKFIWFLGGSVLFYLGLSVIYVFSNDISRVSDLYGVFIFSVFCLYSTFGVWDPERSGCTTIEILFGIPDYRYKVWLVRIY